MEQLTPQLLLEEFKSSEEEKLVNHWTVEEFVSVCYRDPTSYAKCAPNQVERCSISSFITMTLPIESAMTLQNRSSQAGTNLIGFKQNKREERKDLGIQN